MSTAAADYVVDDEWDEWTVMSGRTWKATLHLLADLPIAVALFFGFTVLLTLSAALTPLAGAGLALLVLTLNGAALVGRLEHARARALLDATVRADLAVCPQSVRQMLSVAASGRAWKSCLYALVMFPVGIVNAAVALLGWASAIAAATSQLWVWLLPPDAIGLGSAHLRGENPVVSVTVTVAGLALAFLMPHIVRALSAVDGFLVRRLLG
ncbi:sensor domain-containing protein [Sphaerimonospora thailandensis]|uniref:Putative sensor domain-containing protein n=1 Tax=Sphaerimonospora thailandensis TaxID=795644 RepID=A0A8J3RFK0_9ACTN|nr:sensor domain-containing protein [Sphaerimonospora thailandensis]GIH72972.1 hypothetical protein Mth01_52250 [Sphaerimonospora thailandensis]